MLGLCCESKPEYAVSVLQIKILTCWVSAANENPNLLARCCKSKHNMLGLCCRSNPDMLGLCCESKPDHAGPVPLLSGLGCLFGVLDACFGFWMHLLGSVSLPPVSLPPGSGRMF